MNNDYDPFYSLQYDHEKEKTNHRKTRKSNRRKRVLSFLPKGAKNRGKRWLHRYNRRNYNAASNYYKHDAYSYSSMYWYFS